MRVFSKITTVALGVVAILLPSPTDAHQLSPQEALQRATGISCGTAKKIRANSSYRLSRQFNSSTGSNSTAAIYVMTAQGEPSLFLSADSEAPALLGYTDEPLSDTLPPALEEWLKQCAEVIAIQPSAITVGEATDGLPNVPMLMQSKWRQDSPFNNHTPVQFGIQTPIGCMACAMAQVAYYHQYPVQGKGTASYEWEQGEILSYNFDEHIFDYSQMLPVYNANQYTEAQGEAVAQLCSGCGIAAEMWYNYIESPTTITKGGVGLVNYLDYSKAIHLEYRTAYSLSQWNHLLADELSARRPIIFTGNNSDAGHAFVIDGVNENGYFHVNWGWGGASNGYYLITALNPPSQGIGGSDGGYNINQCALLEVRKPKAGDPSTFLPTSIIQSDFGPEAKSYSRSGYNPMKFVDGDAQTAWKGTMLITLKCARGLKFTKDTGEVYYCWGQEIDWSPGATWTTFGINAGSGYSGIDVPNGTYTVTPAVKTVSETGEELISDAKISISCRQYVMANVSDSEIIITHPKPETISLLAGLPTLNSPLYAGKKGSMQMNITNAGAEYYGFVNFKLKQSYWSSTSYDLGTIFLSLPVDGEEDVTWEGDLPSNIPAGDYLLLLSDYKGHEFGSMPTLTIQEPPAGETVIEMDNLKLLNRISGSGLDYDPTVLNGPSIQYDFDLKCTQGYYSTPIFYRVEGSNNFVTLSPLPQRYLPAGSSEHITGTIDLSNVEYNKIYKLSFFHRTKTSQGYTSDKQLGGYNFIKFHELAVGVENTGSIENTVATLRNGYLEIVNSDNAPLGIVTLSKTDGTVICRFDARNTSRIKTAVNASGGIYVLCISGATGNNTLKLLAK